MGRTIAGAVILAVLWFFAGMAMMSWTLGLALAAWSLFVGPLCMALFYTLRFGSGISMKNYDWKWEKPLAHHTLKLLLRHPGPRPTLWIRPSPDPVFFWWESFFPWQGSSQNLILSSSWISQATENRESEWENLWIRIASLTPEQRRLRSWQICFWMGALSPLEAAFIALHKIIQAIGFKDIPSPSFWFQRFCWDLKKLWFGSETQAAVPESSSHSAGHHRWHPPRVWNGLIWGVWFEVSAHNNHILWPVLVDNEAFVG